MKSRNCKNTISKRDTKHIVSFATLVNALNMVYVVDNEEKLDKLTNIWMNSSRINNLIPELQDYDKRLENKNIL